QIAETITWVVATMIIVVTLIVFIFISSKMADAKNINPSNLVVKDGNFFVSDDVGEISRLETKTKFAFSVNLNNEQKIKEWVDEK
ncbi:MAG: hypothetical protein ABFQ65_01985, partial [Nanoarchaeota archaeon]